jgi:hypothetical protein
MNNTSRARLIIQPYAGVMLSLIMLVMPFAATAEILDYDCVLADAKLSLHVDTQVRTVQQTAQWGSISEVGNYSDGVYGPIFHAGAPSVHQFVRITEGSIYYGGEVRGVEEGAVLDRRLATLTLFNGRSGWCSKRE